VGSTIRSEIWGGYASQTTRVKKSAKYIDSSLAAQLFRSQTARVKKSAKYIDSSLTTQLFRSPGVGLNSAKLKNACEMPEVIAGCAAVPIARRWFLLRGIFSKSVVWVPQEMRKKPTIYWPDKKSDLQKLLCHAGRAKSKTRHHETSVRTDTFKREKGTIRKYALFLTHTC